MNRSGFTIDAARREEYAEVGALMASAYAGLAGFPSRDEQPDYYAMFDDLGALAERPQAALVVARDGSGELLGGVLYFGDMRHYGAGGTARDAANASGLRLLAVEPKARGRGIGRALTLACVERARRRGHAEILLHTTEYMSAAWALYERMGFERAVDLDFLQGTLAVRGFRLSLT